MTKAENQEENRHPAADLLPWYASGSLAEEERSAVEQHLATCDRCRKELEEVKLLKSDLQADHAAQPAPPSDLFERIAARVEVAAPDHEKVQRDRATIKPSWWERLEEWSRGIFAPQWAPAVASLVIVLQVAAIALLLNSLSGPELEQFKTLSDPGVVQPVPGTVVRIRLAFEENASQGEIRALLNEIRGRIVDGPTPAGFYLLEVPVNAQDQAVPEKVLEKLRARPGLVRFAERIE
jgi:anti-sigma factor RsiW